MQTRIEQSDTQLIMNVIITIENSWLSNNM